jgi:Glucose-6-phosphate isomerase
MVKFDFKKYQYKKIESYDLTEVKERFLIDNNMAGWYNLDKSSVDTIKTTASYIRENCDVFVVIGIGGSYLGAKAVIDALAPYFSTTEPEIIFAGHHLSTDYQKELLDYIKDKDVMVNVISKSGTTLEPAISFDLVLDFMETKYGEDGASKRIFATTDEKTGTLLNLANQKGFQRFVVPDDIGGRFSVLTPVGLLPIAVAGFSIDDLFKGAEKAKLKEADYYYYTQLRHELYQMNKVVESFNVYEPKLAAFAEWLKQLFGETQGKQGKGIFPVSTVNTSDLHSLGQYFQDGIDMLFSTTIFAHSDEKLSIKKHNRTLDNINELAMESVAEAHFNGHTPTSIIKMDKINEENLGYLIFFFEMAAMLGSYLIDIDYYDQPGVNGYKDILHEKIKDTK